MSLVQNAKKAKKNISHECKVNQSYTSSGKSVVRRLCIFFLQACSEIYNDGILEDLNYGPTIWLL